MHKFVASSCEQQLIELLRYVHKNMPLNTSKFTPPGASRSSKFIPSGASRSSRPLQSHVTQLDDV